MSKIINKISELQNQFDQFESWEERYKSIIQRGKALKAWPEAERRDELLVKGCQSQVWLRAHRDDSGAMIIEADSEALLVKGLVQILLEVYSGAQPEETLKQSPDFLKDLGFADHLTPSRANGLYAMVKQIRLYAQAFVLLNK